MRTIKWWLSSIVIFCLPLLVWAQIKFDPAKNTIGSDQRRQTLVKSSGTIKALTYLSGASDPVSISIRLVNILLSLLGLISMILLLYAGIVWFKARENEEEVTRAKQIMKGSLTGLVITLLAYGLAYLLFNQIITATTVTKS